MSFNPNLMTIRPNRDPKTGQDALTEILLGLRLDGVEYGRCVMREPWAVAFPAKREASFHFVAQGSCWMHTATQGWLQLNPGDAVLLPHGTAHVMASSQDLPAVEIDSLARKAVSENLYLVSGAGPQDAAAEQVLFCGAMRFNLDPLHPLLAMMPEAMRAADLGQRDPAVHAMLEAMEREVALDRIGACGILARLADVLAASIIRVNKGAEETGQAAATIHASAGSLTAENQQLQAGVHEFLVKPTSAKALHDRLSSIVANPRPMVQLGDAYVPQPRKMATGLELDPPAEPWRV